MITSRYRWTTAPAVNYRCEFGQIITNYLTNSACSQGDYALIGADAVSIVPERQLFYSSSPYQGMSPREHALLVLLYRKFKAVGVHTLLPKVVIMAKTNVLKRKMAKHTLEWSSPDGR